MLKAYLRLIAVTTIAACFLPTFTLVAFHRSLEAEGIVTSGTDGDVTRLGVIGGLAAVAIAAILFASRNWIRDVSEQQHSWMSNLPSWSLDAVILISATVSLSLELAVIRWQGSVFEHFAYYKNLSLLSCFVGLGIGYSLSRLPQLPLLLVLPLLAFQMGMLRYLRFGLGDRARGLSRSVVKEQLIMGAGTAKNVYDYLSIYWLLAVVFLLTALIFLPIGQWCGLVMDRRAKLRAYGLNLLGSVVGVLSILAISYFWLEPVWWFGGGLLVLVAFQCFRLPTAILSLGSSAAIAAVLWITLPGGQRIYSPYQMLELGRNAAGNLELRAAGHYFQAINDFSEATVRATVDPHVRHSAAYYGLPYLIHGRPDNVCIVGAGTGNDVSAALRAGAKHVDAVEIDPAIVLVGREAHPERPYQDPRTRSIVNDARTHLRSTDEKYDMIVYGLLDSHTLLSHASNVRLDSFVYTVEGLREARARLKEGGTLSLAFCVLSPELARKFFLMMQEAFDGRPPKCIQANYDRAVLFIQSEGTNVTLPPKEELERAGFVEVTSVLDKPIFQADVSTDDWPFLYMPVRVYPTSYLVMAGLILVLSLVLLAAFFREKPTTSDGVFFFLGAGFMLIETKGITELGLAFGNTWHVIGFVLIGILCFAFLANAMVSIFQIQNATIPYVLLLGSILFGVLVAGNESLFTPTTGGRVASLVVLTGPIFFSGIVFSSLLSAGGNVSRIMAVNLFGAMCGGLLEYNSMYFGFRFLYWLALGIYGLAFVLSWRRTNAIEPASV
ncbi:MAG: hypothetical protein U1D30_10145 [Planctomycetota bacterium]